MTRSVRTPSGGRRPDRGNSVSWATLVPHTAQYRVMPQLASSAVPMTAAQHSVVS